MTTNKNQRGTYARVNGLDLYYELHGSGQPLVVLPGSFWTIEAMGAGVSGLSVGDAVFGVSNARFTTATGSMRPRRRA